MSSMTEERKWVTGSAPVAFPITVNPLMNMDLRDWKDPWKMSVTENNEPTHKAHKTE